MTITFSNFPAAECETSAQPVQRLLAVAQTSGKEVTEKPCFAVSAVETMAATNAKRKTNYRRDGSDLFQGIDSVPFSRTDLCSYSGCEVTTKEW